MPKISVLKNPDLIFEELRKGLKGSFHLVVVFGSFARGDMGFFSDLDLLVVGSKQLKEQVLKVLDHLAEKYGLYTDLIFMTEEEFNERKEYEPIKGFLRNGKIIFGEIE